MKWFITGATNLMMEYILLLISYLGANNSNSTATVTFANGRGSFIPPAADLNASEM